MYNSIFPEMLSRVQRNLRAHREENRYMVRDSPGRAALLDGCNFGRRHGSASRAEHVAIRQGVVSEARSAVEATA